MRLLLDTHVWIWTLTDRERLSTQAAEAIEDPGTQLWLSPVSVWEALLLLQRGRFGVAGQPEDWVRARLRGFPVQDAPLTREVAIASRTIDLEHEDPADRFIAASAMVHDLTLLTADSLLLSSDVIRTMAA